MRRRGRGRSCGREHLAHSSSPDGCLLSSLRYDLELQLTDSPVASLSTRSWRMLGKRGKGNKVGCCLVLYLFLRDGSLHIKELKKKECRAIRKNCGASIGSEITHRLTFEAEDHHLVQSRELEPVVSAARGPAGQRRRRPSAVLSSDPLQTSSPAFN